MTAGRALVVEDDAVSRLVLARMLGMRGWTVEEAVDVPDALEHLDRGRLDLVIADLHLPSGTGIAVLDALHLRPDPPPFVLVTGLLEHVALREAGSSAIAARLTKPVSSESLRRALESLFPSVAR